MKNLREMQQMFKESLDIVDNVITVNACDAGDKSFELLKKILKQMARDILVSLKTVYIAASVFFRHH